MFTVRQMIDDLPVTRRGTETAMLVPVGEWRRLQVAARPSLKQLLLADSARTDNLVPERGKAQRRRRPTQPERFGQPSARLDPQAVRSGAG